MFLQRIFVSRKGKNNMRKKWKERYQRQSIQAVILSALTGVSAFFFLILAIIFTNYMEDILENFMREKKGQQTEFLAESVEQVCKEAIDFFDTVYYKIIKKENFQGEGFTKLLDFVCEENKNLVENLVLYNEQGDILYENQQEDVQNLSKAKQEEMMQKAKSHVGKTWFEKDESFQDILMYRFVEINHNGEIQPAVLAGTLKYQRIVQAFQMQEDESYGYSYMKTADGTLIYHPKGVQLQHGVYTEKLGKKPITADGIHEEKLEGKRYLVRQRTVGYTGWKIIGIASLKEGVYEEYPIKLLIWCLFGGMGILVICINRYIVQKITGPIERLSKRAEQFDDSGFDKEIEEEGTYEVRQLAESFNQMRKRIKQLMMKAVQKEQEYWDMQMKLLQSQINPHFLYNTLDSIIWMIESKRYEGAVKMVTALAGFFRISLNKGEDFITVEKELLHVKNYMEIQGIRFEDKFSFDVEIEENIKKYICPKLIVQPLAENAVYHGMESMYGDGEIHISAREENSKICITVFDNGEGMSDEQIKQIMAQKVISSRRGSGIGVRNVDRRIKHCFGEKYGITIESEMDEGTVVKIWIPKVEDMNEYWKENFSVESVADISSHRGISVEGTEGDSYCNFCRSSKGV